jgi:homoserine kinase
MRVTARVPATSANLGPGFDCFGLALDLANEVTVDTEADPAVTWEGEGADELPVDGSDMVSRAIRNTLDRRERPGAGAPRPFALHGVNRIPLERGLGSSSAAVVAGTAIALGLLDGGVAVGDPQGFAATVFAHAAELEGHPDNAAAATYGGFTVVASGVVKRLDLHPAVVPVALVPERQRVATARAREVLPATVPRVDAVFNVGQAAFTVIAFTQDPELLPVALHDRLHQEARSALMPGSAALLGELRRRRVPACLSGAGPSVLAFETADHEVGDLPEGWRALRLGVRTAGVELVVDG